MRLLFLTSETCPTFRADVAGLFGKYLPSYGVYSDIVTTTTPNHEGPVNWGGGRAILCSAAGGEVSKHFRKFLHCVKQLLAADRESYQAIQVRDMPFFAAFALIVAGIKRLPFVYWMSYPMPEGQIARAEASGLGKPKSLLLWLRGHIGKFLMYRLVLPSAKHVFVQSEQMKRDVIEHDLQPARVTSVPMGVDLEGLCSANISPSDDKRLLGRQVVVYLGTLDRPRHIEVLFEMLACVRQALPQVLLVLVGDTHDGAHRDWLKAQAREAGVEADVLWTGWLPMREGWRYVLAGRIGLSPFPRGFLLDSASPTKVPEYLALGIPVVCNENPDQQGIIEASGAGICVTYTPKAFAEAVITLLNEPESVRVNRIRSGRQYVISRRDYSVIAKQVADAYLTFVGE